MLCHSNISAYFPLRFAHTREKEIISRRNLWIYVRYKTWKREIQSFSFILNYINVLNRFCSFCKRFTVICKERERGGECAHLQYPRTYTPINQIELEKVNENGLMVASKLMFLMQSRFLFARKILDGENEKRKKWQQSYISLVVNHFTKSMSKSFHIDEMISMQVV